MKLNKKGKPYIEPDQPKKCRVVNKLGEIYHATNAPQGFCKCGIMLQLNTKKTDFIFESRVKALHAREHTIRWLTQNGFEVDYDDFIVEYVK